MTALVSVTVTVNVAATPPALLEMEPLHVPAVGDTAATATAKFTAAPGAEAVAEPTAAIVATVPGRLLAAMVHVSNGVKVGASPL
jgi:biotin carboxyl carrier protein